ncbi:hypothetical protein LguiA_016994 [Lonicera macranthoides]
MILGIMVAKKHLSDMLTNRDEKEAMKRQLPNLGRILSTRLQLSPWGSPRNDGEPGFITAQMRLSPGGNIHTHRLVQEDNAVHLSSSKQEAGIKILPKTDYPQDSSVLDVLCDASGSLIASDDQNHDTNEDSIEEEYHHQALRKPRKSKIKIVLLIKQSDQVPYPYLSHFSWKMKSALQPPSLDLLLFDCTNEVLKEVCERYFGFYSFVKHKIRPVRTGISLIEEVWEGAEWHLLCYPPHHSLDQLVRKDMAKSGSWMDLQFEKESMVIELINLVLEEMTEETVSSFINERNEGEALVLIDKISEDE